MKQKSFKKPLLLALLVGALGGCLASGDRPLQLIQGADPKYPAAARQQGVQGFVTVGYRVTAEGRVEDLVVLKAQPPGVFDAAALAAVQRWRYNAPKQNGQPQAAESVVSTIEFKLADADSAARYEGL